MGALYALSSQRAADAGLQASTQWAVALARAAASATAPLLVRSDQEGMEKALRDIWSDSAAFNLYRGTGWMKEPCQPTVPCWVPFMMGMSKRMPFSSAA